MKIIRCIRKYSSRSEREMNNIFPLGKDNTWKNEVLPVQVELVPPCRKRRNEKKYKKERHTKGMSCHLYFKQLGGYLVYGAA